MHWSHVYALTQVSRVKLCDEDAVTNPHLPELDALGRATARAMSESDLQDAIVELSHAFGFSVAHFTTARTNTGGYRTPTQYDAVGFPDLLLVGERGVVFIEVKTERGKLSTEQAEWILRVNRAKHRAYVFRPSDWLSGAVERELRREG